MDDKEELQELIEMISRSAIVDGQDVSTVAGLIKDTEAKFEAGLPVSVIKFGLLISVDFELRRRGIDPQTGEPKEFPGWTKEDSLRVAIEEFTRRAEQDND